jgi:RND family efflux transporter MFP subunit
MINFFLCLVILGAGIAGATYLNKTAPKARKRRPPRMDPLVKVEMIQKTNERVTVQAMGTVIPGLQMVLKSRVPGEVVTTHPEFIEGGILMKGTKVLQIDPSDYKLSLAQKKSRVANARYALKLELGHQDVAKREWELLKGDKPPKKLDRELALRKPHLEKAWAELDAAKADLKMAELDLSRTTIFAPFNAIVRKTMVEVGSQITTQDSLAELVGTDEYWIQVSIPVDRLKWITIPTRTGNDGANVRISYGSGPESSHVRKGKVIKLLGDLEAEGRMARILVSVKDPLDRKNPNKRRPPLLIGEYVRVEIDGRELKDVYKIPRTALRDNSRIWVTGNDELLKIREVVTVWRGPEYVLLKDGLKEGEWLIVSDLATPVEGMTVLTKHPVMQKRDGPGISSSQVGKSGGKFLRRFDSDGDGRVSVEEFKGPSHVFQRLDKDDDGFVTKDEIPKSSSPDPNEG